MQKITIQDGRKKPVILKAQNWLLITSDTNGEKGMQIRSNSKSIPQRMGWLRFAVALTDHEAQRLFALEGLAAIAKELGHNIREIKIAQQKLAAKKLKITTKK